MSTTEFLALVATIPATTILAVLFWARALDLKVDNRPVIALPIIIGILVGVVVQDRLRGSGGRMRICLALLAQSLVALALDCLVLWGLAALTGWGR